MLKKGLWIFAGSLAGGLAAGWGTGRPELAADGPADSPPAREMPRAKWTKDDFLKAARERSELVRQPGYNPYAEVLAEWSDAEIRAALEESLTHPDCALSFGGGLDMFLLSEWMARDFDAAISWFDRLESQAAKQRMAMGLSYRWPADRAPEGLAFVRANRDLFSRGSPWAILVKNVEHAAKSGPAAVAELLGELREEKFDLSFGNPVTFPAGFDFAALLETGACGEIGTEGLARSILHGWHAQDPDRAFDWLLEHRGAADLAALAWNPLGSGSGNSEWLGKRVERLEPDQRQDFLAAVRERWIFSPAAMQGFAAGVRDPALRDELGGLAVQSVFAGDAHAAMPVLEAIPEPARRIEMFEAAEPDEVFARQPFRRRFDAADEAVLRRKLAEWGAGEERTEAILSRFKP